MTYAVQTIEAHGIPTTEYRVASDLEPQIITIECRPPSHPKDEFEYPHPKFKFWEEVAIVDQYIPTRYATSALESLRTLIW
jgi:hypothetical protein